MPGSPTGPAGVLLLGPLTTKVCVVLGEGKVNVKAIYRPIALGAQGSPASPALTKVRLTC